MMFFKKIWRFVLKRYKNSRAQYLLSKIFEALKFEGFYVSYSQFGEDLILENLFRDKEKGFYIDVGCNRPIEGNNTFKFYLKGWRGINIDGNPNLIADFKRVRPKDTNLNFIISDSDQSRTFFINKNDDRVSTISNEFKEWIKESRTYDEEIQVIPRTLTSVLQEYAAEKVQIDLLNIDVEGHDFEVLTSLDLEMYAPKIICIEDHLFDFSKPNASNIFSYLTGRRYKLTAFSYPNLYFVHD